MGQCVLSSFDWANEGTTTVYAASQDFSGNTGSVVSATFKLDQEWPETTVSVSPSTPNGLNGWYTEPVGISTSASDNLSGVGQTRCAADPESAPASYTALPSGACAVTNVTGDGTHHVYVASQDVAGNNEPVQDTTFKIDGTGPSDSPLVSGSVGDNGWYTSDVSLAWNWSDAASGIDSPTCTTGGSTSGEGAALTIDGSCKDKAGNSSSDSKSFKVDKTKPTISAAATAPPNGTNGWYTSNVTVHFTCADSVSGIPSGGCPANQTLSTESSSVSSTAETVNDNAGNTSDQSNVVTVKIDKTAPSVAVTGVTNGAQYSYGSVPAAGCSTSDGLSGVATQASVAITGGSGGVGSLTATCSGAVDNAGNQAPPVSVSYTVVYDFGGFSAPQPSSTVTYKTGAILHVAFTLTNSTGQALGPAVASKLAGKLTVTLTGPGIAPITGLCAWNTFPARFQCSLQLAGLTQFGRSNPYQLIASENLTGTAVPTPQFTNTTADANPETVYFEKSKIQPAW